MRFPGTVTSFAVGEVTAKSGYVPRGTIDQDGVALVWTGAGGGGPAAVVSLDGTIWDVTAQLLPR